MKINKILCPIYYTSFTNIVNIAFASANICLTYKELYYLIHHVSLIFSMYKLHKMYILVITDNPVFIAALYFAALKTKNTIILYNIKYIFQLRLDFDTLPEIDLVIGELRWVSFLSKKADKNVLSFQELKSKINKYYYYCIFCQFYKSHNIYFFQNYITGVLTAGSTGQSKVCYHDFSNHLFSIISLNKYVQLTYLDRWLLTLPVYHVSGLSVILRSLFTYSTIILSQNFDNTQDIEAVLGAAKSTFLSIVNTQLYRFRYFDFFNPLITNLKCILVGGSVTNLNIIGQYKFFYKQLILSTYGLSETFSQVYINCLSPMLSCTLLPYRQFKIDKFSNLIVRGNVLLKYYVFCKGQLSSKSFSQMIVYYIWFITKDLSCISLIHGCYIRGRTDYVFSRAGEKISPEEIEQALNQLPNIFTSVVIPIQNKEFENIPIAYICMKDGYLFNECATKVLLLNLLSKNKIPKRLFNMPLHFLSEFKINRKELKTYYYNN
nr:O-succinylbenzoic acid-CoA ligase [Cavernulicola chilensis]